MGVILSSSCKPRRRPRIDDQEHRDCLDQWRELLTQVGSTLVTNAVLRRPPKATPAPSVDYTTHWPELRSVDFTAAAEDNFSVMAVDASASTKKSLFVRSVWFTAACYAIRTCC